MVDRIFTRVGASDDLATGQSTFMVEMTETANILNNATPRSLVILDEIGRGTSTFDGLSIAWAVAEYLHESPRLGCKTLFATHYHQLNELENTLPRAKNYRIAVKEGPDGIVFLRKIVPGGTDRSYGIHVARLAGLPAPVLERAQQVLQSLEENDQIAEQRARPGGQTRHHPPAAPRTQLTLFEMAEHPVVDELSPSMSMTSPRARHWICSRVAEEGTAEVTCRGERGQLPMHDDAACMRYASWRGEADKGIVSPLLLAVMYKKLV